MSRKKSSIGTGLGEVVVVVVEENPNAVIILALWVNHSKPPTGRHSRLTDFHFARILWHQGYRFFSSRPEGLDTGWSLWSSHHLHA